MPGSGIQCEKQYADESSGGCTAPNDPAVVTVPGNDGKELAPGTLNAILKKARLK
ncbi:MAG: type II toxin-antitoxin system HicA family toxin [bacterium]|nr:type II toxin-antitoxin system HicA family toxin [bacterium]